MAASSVALIGYLTGRKVSQPLWATSRTPRSILNMPAYHARYFGFINFLKQAQQVPVNKNPSNYLWQTSVNSDGYPTRAPDASNGLHCRVYLPTGYTGNWVVKWKGRAGCIISDVVGKNITIVNSGGGVGSITPTNLVLNGGRAGVTSRVVFKFRTPASVTTFAFSYYAGSTSDIADIVLCQEPEENLLDAGQIYRSDFLDVLRALNPSALRFMEQTAQYTPSPLSDFTFENQLSTICWAGDRYDPRLWAGDIRGSTVNGVDHYICAAPANYPSQFPSNPTDGAMFQGRFLYASAGAAQTLQVGSWPAKPLLTNGGNTWAALGNSVVEYQSCTFVYNSTLGWICGVNNGGLQSTTPIAAMINLCNTLNCHFWYNINYLYSDAAIAAAISYIARDLKPNLALYVEWANEVWNSQFYSTGYASKMGNALGIASNKSDYDTYYGLRVCQVMELAAAAWTGAGRTMSTLKRVMAVRGSALGVLTPSMISSRLEGVNLGSYGFNVLGNRPIDHCDVISYAPYYQGAQCTGPTNYASYKSGYDNFGAAQISGLTAAADSFAVGTPEGIAAAMSFLDNDFRRGTIVSEGHWSCKPITAIKAIVTGSTSFTVPSGMSWRNGWNVLIYSAASPDNYMVGPITKYSGTLLVVDAQATGGSGTFSDWKIETLPSESLLVLNSLYYPSWNRAAINYGKTIHCYEGGFQAVAPNAAACTAMGINASYGDTVDGIGRIITLGKIGQMLEYYKFGSLFESLIRDQFTEFMSFSNSGMPCWFDLIEGPYPGPNVWSMFSGDLYSRPFGSFNAVANFNN